MVDNIKKPDINFRYANGHLKNGGYWWNIGQRDDLTMEFVREYADYINWYSLSKNSWFEMDEQFIEEFQDRFNWRSLARFSPCMNEQLIEKHLDKIDWASISFKKYLSDEFIMKYAGEIIWSVLFKYRQVDEEWLEKFANIITEHNAWDAVCQFQKLSPEFVKKHNDKMNYLFLSNNYKTTYYWRKEYRKIWKNQQEEGKL